MTITELAEQTTQLSHVYHVTPVVYDSFQRCSEDMNPLHTDESFAREKGFPGCVMYGNILNAGAVNVLHPQRLVFVCGNVTQASDGAPWDFLMTFT